MIEVPQYDGKWKQEGTKEYTPVKPVAENRTPLPSAEVVDHIKGGNEKLQSTGKKKTGGGSQGPPVILPVIVVVDCVPSRDLVNQRENHMEKQNFDSQSNDSRYKGIF